MTIDDFNKSLGIKFSQTIVIDEGGNIKIHFPSTQDFIAQIERKRNTEKLHNILKKKDKNLFDKYP